MGRWIVQISYDQIYLDANLIHDFYYDMFGIFQGIRAHHGRDPITWNKIANYEQQYGQPKNTLAELKRLNHFTNPNAQVPMYYGAIYAWNRYYLDDSGCCGGGGTEVTDYYGLRMNQRTDGKGVMRHPRLAASKNSSTAKYDPRTSRVGDRNRLDGAFKTYTKD